MNMSKLKLFIHTVFWDILYVLPTNYFFLLPGIAKINVAFFFCVVITFILVSLNRIVEEQQTDWKRQRWQKMKIRILQKLLRGQSEMLHQLPEKAHNWDVAIGLQESINDILVCYVCYLLF